jgi:hypothetical protein
MTLLCEHALFLHECFFNIVFHFVAMDGKIKQHVCIKFCVKLGKSDIVTLEMLLEAFGEHSHFKAVDCQLKMPNVQGDQAPEKQQRMLKKSRTCPRRPLLNNP